MNKKFQALVVEERDSTFFRSIQEKSVTDLPEGELFIRVLWSSLNYKDALSATGNRGVTRGYPHTPGIDAAGIVEESSVETFGPGDKVIVTSYDLGMNTPGGFGQYIRVPAAWVLRLPEGLTLKESMMLGTAGLTAGMSVAALCHCHGSETGEVLVTGATGGVGCLAVSILAGLGYSVTAVSGKHDAAAFLSELGVKKILSREEATDTTGRPLLKPLWAGVVDTVGGDILATAIKSTHTKGVVTCCGNVASPELNLTVFPFILRGVSLIGIDSQNLVMERRKGIWQRLATDWKPPHLKELCREVPLSELDEQITIILKGGQTGRILVNLGVSS